MGNTTYYGYYSHFSLLCLCSLARPWSKSRLDACNHPAELFEWFDNLRQRRNQRPRRVDDVLLRRAGQYHRFRH